MIFYANKGRERIYALTMPIDDGPLHLPDLAKLGISAFQSSFPDISLRNDEIVFGFEFEDAPDSPAGSTATV